MATLERICATCGAETDRIHDKSDVECYAMAQVEERRYSGGPNPKVEATEPVLLATYIPDGGDVVGYLVLDSTAGLVDCEMATACGGFTGKPVQPAVVTWALSGDMMGECVDCLQVNTQFDNHDQRITAVEPRV